LKLTNQSDAYRGQSRSLNMVPFEIGKCAIATLSQKHAVFQIFDFKKADVEIQVRGHSRSLKVVGLPFDRLVPLSGTIDTVL